MELAGIFAVELPPQIVELTADCVAALWIVAQRLVLGGKWTITAFAELGNASVGEEVTSGQIKVYAADTVDGLESASALTDGVTIENKSAVKSTIQVPATGGKFFKVKFGE